MEKARRHMLFWLAIVMIASLFFSRTLLAFSIAGFVLVSFLHERPFEVFKTFFRQPVLWGMSLLFLLPMISGMWSENIPEWIAVMQMKSPLLFLPLAFASRFEWTSRQWNTLALIFIALVLGGTCWSMYDYLQHINLTNQSYLKAKTLATPLENDHVRFSWLVNIGIIACIYLVANNGWKWIWCWLLFPALWLIIYLHLLAARTGLISFYITLFLLSAYLVYKRVNWKHGLLLFLMIIILPVLSYWVFPSFQNRIKYLTYEKDYLSHAAYLPGSNDAVRVLSMKAGWGIMNEHPLTGVGFGDLRIEVNKWYEDHYPQMIAEDKIYPSSEWLIYGASGGFMFFIGFSGIMLLFILQKMPDRLTWRVIAITAAVSLVADIGLEVQFGVFVYSFVVLWWWKWIKEQKM